MTTTRFDTSLTIGEKQNIKIGVILDPVLAVFHDFGLTFFLHNVPFVLLKMSKNAFYMVVRLPQRLKSTFFEIFSSLHWPLAFVAALFEKVSKNIDCSL